MGKRGRSIGTDVNVDDHVVALRRYVLNDIRELSRGGVDQLLEPVAKIDEQVTAVNGNPSIVKDILHSLTSEQISKLVTVSSTHFINNDKKLTAFSKILFLQLNNIIIDLKLKLNMAEQLIRNVTEYLLVLSFADDCGNLQWSELVKSLSSAAVKSGERNVQQEAQQMIQNMQQQANQVIQQAQQQAMQAQGDMQL